jgi:hypothetical protein
MKPTENDAGIRFAPTQIPATQMETALQPHTIAVFFVFFFVPIILSLLGLQAANGFERIRVDKSNHTFRLKPWLGWLYSICATGLPVALVSYWLHPDGWRVYFILGLLFGLLGLGGLIEYFRTSLTFQNPKVYYQGLFRKIEFDLSEVRSASLEGQVILVDIGRRRLALPIMFKYPRTIVDLLNGVI